MTKVTKNPKAGGFFAEFRYLNPFRLDVIKNISSIYKTWSTCFNKVLSHTQVKQTKMMNC